MSGLLRRLASQTLSGAKPVLRPLSRMRYVAPLELSQDETGPHAGVRFSILDEEGAPGSSPPARTASEPLPVAGREPGAGKPVPRPARPAAADEGTPLAGDAGRRTSDRVATPRSTEIVHRAAFAQDRCPAAIAPRPDGRESAPARTPEPVVAAVEPAAAPTGRGVAIPPPPARLVPSVEVAARLSLRKPGSGRPAPPASVHDDNHDPAEVHVHIGRIEVTAVHESPPPKRTRQPARDPMSLDEYLSRRGGRPG